MSFFEGLGLVGGLIAVLVVIGLLAFMIRLYVKVPLGKALIVNGVGGIKVNFSGRLVLPVIHRAEMMDITVKRIQIEREGSEGLICKDNMRADIKVAFFVKVNSTMSDVEKVATVLGVERASQSEALVDHFDAKFSEALKTVGKQFDFVELYEARDLFKQRVIETIGQDLDGYILDDCAIDFLEQTEIGNLSADNILDSEGIKKITELTATQKVLANQIDRDREKTIKRQNVEAEEAVLEMDRQLSESQERQKREIANIKAREAAEAHKVQQEERLKAESARLQTEEELAVAEENKQRQVIVAKKNKERTEAIETERITKDRMLEETERERVVDLARIEKERALEVERKNIQDVIRERVTVEKTVVEEEEKIKDCRALAEAERTKNVALVNAEQIAEESRVKFVKAALADKEAAVQKAEQKVVEAEADQKAADKSAEARKVLAEAQAAEEAALGMAEVKVAEARADAREKEGTAEAIVTEKLALAEAKGIEAKADANLKQGGVEAQVLEQKAVAEAKGAEAKAQAMAKQGEARADVLRMEMEAKAQGTFKQGEAEATVAQKMAQSEAYAIEATAEARKKDGTAQAEVLELTALAQARGDEAASVALEKRGGAEAANLLKRFQADAQGIREKAEAMKLFDDKGRAHEEFKLLTEKDRELALAEIAIRKDIAASQATVLAEGLRSANIDIVGGDTLFFDKLMGAVTQSKYVDRLVGGSKVLNDVKESFFNGDPAYFKGQLKQFIDQFGLNTEDLKNITLSAAIGKMMHAANDDKTKGVLQSILTWAEKFGLDEASLDDLKK